MDIYPCVYSQSRVRVRQAVFVGYCAREELSGGLLQLQTLLQSLLQPRGLVNGGMCFSNAVLQMFCLNFDFPKVVCRA